MCHQARTSGSALSALEQRLEPAVATGRGAAPAPPRSASAGERPSSPGPAASTSSAGVSSAAAIAPSSHAGRVAGAGAPARVFPTHGWPRLACRGVGECGRSVAVPTPASRCPSAVASAASRRCSRSSRPSCWSARSGSPAPSRRRRPDPGERRRLPEAPSTSSRSRDSIGRDGRTPVNSSSIGAIRSLWSPCRRPEKRNALSIELRSELADAFAAPLGRRRRSAASSSPARARAFCSGMDTSQFGGDRAHRERLVETSTVAFEAVGDCPRPVVAAVNGPALAGGFALSLLCDLRIAAPAATFGYPELPRGIPPSYAAARAVLPATVAQELCLTGRVVERAGGAAARDRARGDVRGDVVERAVEPRRARSRRCRASDPRDEAPHPAGAQPPVGLPVRRGGARLQRAPCSARTARATPA